MMVAEAFPSSPLCNVISQLICILRLDSSAPTKIPLNHELMSIFLGGTSPTKIPSCRFKRAQQLRAVVQLIRA
jgi:hypothetical protein